MARLCLVLCCVLMALSLVESKRVLKVNGQRCMIGAFMMYVPPGEEPPVSCPSFVDEDEGCFLGDMKLNKQQCIEALEKGEEDYNNLPRAAYEEE